MSIISGLTYLLITKIIMAIRFLTLFWFSYAVSRLITILVDGPLGEFGNQWLTIETAFFVLGAVLLFANQMNKD